MDRELRAVARALCLRRGRAATAPARVATGIVAARVGVGRARASASTVALLDALHPRCVLVAGVAGAIDPALRVGDVIAPISVLDAATGSRFVPTQLPSGPEHGVARRQGVARRHGVLVTVAPDAPGGVSTSLGDRAGGPTDGAAAVDMETAAVAAVCAARAVPWDVVRAISDVPGTVTPAVAALVRSDGRTDLLAAIALVLRAPREVVRLARLARDTRRALDALGRAVRDQLDGR